MASRRVRFRLQIILGKGAPLHVTLPRTIHRLGSLLEDPGLDPDLAVAVSGPPRQAAVAPDRTDFDPLPCQLRLRRRIDRRRCGEAMPTALRRISPPMGIRDLSCQPRRLLGLLPADRLPRRHLRSGPRHRLRGSTSTTQPSGSNPRRINRGGHYSHTQIITKPGESESIARATSRPLQLLLLSA